MAKPRIYVSFFGLFTTLILTLSTTPALAAVEQAWKRVTHVIDGDTFVTDDGSHVRLLNINTAEIDRQSKRSEPFANQALTQLTKTIMNQRVRLVFGERHKDRYGRLLAHVYTEKGQWVNKMLIDLGLAHVYTFPDNRSHGKTLIKHENIAKKQKVGMWAHPRWKTYTQVGGIPDSAIGQFNHYEGKVVSAKRVRDRTYLNFGDNWRTDFSVEIPSRFEELFKQSGIDIEKDYTGKKLQIRGVFMPVNGILVRATHPEQLTIIP